MLQTSQIFAAFFYGKIFWFAALAIVIKLTSSVSTNENNVKKFMSESGMTENFSRMCLEQNQWNYNKAAEKFLELKNSNQIPADAWQPGRAPK